MSGAETHYRSLGIDECQLVEDILNGAKLYRKEQWTVKKRECRNE